MGGVCCRGKTKYMFFLGIYWEKNLAHFLNVNEHHTQEESVHFFTEFKYPPHLHKLQWQYCEKQGEGWIFTPNISSFSGDEQPEDRSALHEHFKIKMKE